MRKLTNFLMMTAIVFGFAACNNEEGPEVPTTGNTFASLEIGYAPMNSPQSKSTRAVSETSFEGTSVEKAVKTITLFGEKATNQSMHFTSPFAKATNLWTVKAWPTDAGKRSFGLGLNFSPAPSVDLAIETLIDGNILDGSITQYVTTESIAMSSTDVKDQTINPGVSEAQANSGTSEVDNLVVFDVKRIVAKAAVRAATTEIDVTEGTAGTKLGSISGLTFAPSNLSKKSFLFEKDNLDPNMLDEQATEVGVAASNYARLGDSDLKDFVAPEANVYHPYKAVTMNSTEDKLADIEGNYFFENIEKALFWGNITYIKVYGTYTPNLTQIQQLNSSKDALENPTEFTPGATFYKGAVDGKLYTSVEAAQFAVAGQQAYMYQYGRMGYRVLVYQDPAAADFDTNSKPVTNADVLRNYFYILDITAIQGLGFNYDGNDPNDPNLPKPDSTKNPNEPTDPEDGIDKDTPINTTDTYMRVQATVLPWTVVGRDVILK